MHKASAQTMLGHGRIWQHLVYQRCHSPPRVLPFFPFLGGPSILSKNTAIQNSKAVKIHLRHFCRQGARSHHTPRDNQGFHAPKQHVRRQHDASECVKFYVSHYISLAQNFVSCILIWSHCLSFSTFCPPKR